MSIIAKKTAKSSVPPLAADTYTARCIGVVDLGEQRSEKFNKWQHKVLLIFEVIGEKVDVDGEQKPRWLSNEFTLSLSDKSLLYKTIQTWFNRDLTDAEAGNGFDLALLLNRPAMLTVGIKEKNDSTFNRITAITSVPKSITVPEAESEQIYFDISEWDEEVFGKLPEWMRNRIKNSAEYQQRLPQGVENIDITDEQEDEQAGEAKKAETPNVPF